MLPAAVEAMTEQAARVGNASSLHTTGRAARAVVEESRERIASVLGARPSEVVFTSGGTEADNLAVKGTVLARPPEARHLVCSAVEHHAVLDAAALGVRRPVVKAPDPRERDLAGAHRARFEGHVEVAAGQPLIADRRAGRPDDADVEPGVVRHDGPVADERQQGALFDPRRAAAAPHVDLDLGAGLGQL